MAPEAPPLPLETLVCASTNQVSSRVGEEVVILDLDRSTYYALDPVGARIFELLQRPTSLEAVLAAIVGEFEVDAQTARADLLALVDTLLVQKLVEVNPGDAR